MSREHAGDVIKQHYRKEAQEQGLALSSTMRDATTRKLEIETLLTYISDGDTCLEVGCGNGAASVAISRARNISLTCLDFSPDLIALARRQPTEGIKGQLSFVEQDVRSLEDLNRFDLVFTERCIINLLDHNEQREALLRMARAVRPGGRLLLLEAFQDGLDELNRARLEIGLPPNVAAYHNLLLSKDQVIADLAGHATRFESENNFLSTYYFGSRVLYPALARAGGQEIVYNNIFGKFFAGLPPIGNYSHIKLLTFRKDR